MNLTIRKAREGELDTFVRFLKSIQQGMDHKEWYYVDSPEEFRAYMESGAMHIWFAMDGETIAGAFDLLIPGMAKYNYGRLLDFTDRQLMQVVNMDNAAVHPAYRGHGLQRKLIQEAEKWLGRERDRILMCTVHPDNRYSLQNALKEGYTIRKKLDIYGSVRYLLQKNLQKNEK